MPRLRLDCVWSYESQRLKKGEFMKSMITLFNLTLTTVLCTYSYAGNASSKERILKDETTKITVELNAKMVRCSSLGYGREELKVSVPDLTYLAIFNHANFGETLPCMSAGACQDGNLPVNLIDATKPTEDTDVRVQLVEILSLDDKTSTCNRVLEERVSAQIRGRAFRHVHSADLGSYPYSICTQL